jgi:hypothetical protein
VVRHGPRAALLATATGSMGARKRRQPRGRPGELVVAEGRESPHPDKGGEV